MTTNQNKSNETHYRLSEIEMAKAIELYNKYDGSLNDIIRELFNDPTEKGTSERGRAVRALMIKEGLKYTTTGSYKKKKTEKKIKWQQAVTALNKKREEKVEPSEYELTSQEKAFVRENYSVDVTKSELARLIWSQEAYGKFFDGPKYKALAQFVADEFPEIVGKASDGLEGTNYTPPKQISTTIKRAVKAIGVEIDANKLSSKQKKCFERLLVFLNSPRFLQIMNSYVNEETRGLFENEYIRAVWDKPDLSVDELNLYINICMDYVNLREIEKQKQKLNKMFNDTNGDKEYTMRLIEMIKTKSEEYNQCSNRIDKTISKLNGDRGKRLEKEKQSTITISSLCEAFAEENERKLMIEMAEKQKEIIKEEADRLEEMPQWKSRILGISKYEAI
jgi:hypothetical protein